MGGYDAVLMNQSEVARLAGLPTPHGTRAGYNAGCRCDDCRAANTARQRAKRASRRESEAARGPQYPQPDAPQQTPSGAAEPEDPVTVPDGSRERAPAANGESQSDGGWAGVLAVAAVLTLLGLALWAAWRRGEDGGSASPRPWNPPGPTQPGGFY